MAVSPQMLRRVMAVSGVIRRQSLAPQKTEGSDGTVSRHDFAVPLSAGLSR
jgi:hypothetical protein